MTLVQGKGRVLVVDNVGGDSGLVLPDALAQRQITLDVVRPTGFPQELSELLRYDAVLFQNVPAEAITGPQQLMLARYVNDLGGGFVMLGGPDSFGAGGWTNSIIDERILPVDCEIPSQTVMPSGALVIVIDRSGSMDSPVGNSGRSQQELASEAAALAIQTLYPHDLIGVVAFDSSATEIVPLQPNRDPQTIMRTVRSIQPGGGTEIYAGLERGYQMLTADSPELRDSSLRHIILLSDGQSGGNYTPLINQLRRANITLSTIGVGDSADGQLLEALAVAGGGEYHPVIDPNDLPQIFIKEARTIRKNLIREVEFVPLRQNTGSPIMVNLPATPPLRGLVLTGPKYDRRIDTPLLGPEGEPLFAHWQVGLGKAAAFTSDATNRWAAAWLDWPGYGDFWARTVRYLSRPSASRQAELTVVMDGDMARLRLDLPADEVRGDLLRVAGKLLGPDGELVDVTLQQIGPGLYEAAVPAGQTGSYLANLFVTDPAGQRETLFVAGGATRVPGPELRRFAPNRALLEQVAAVTGGRVLDPASPATAGLFAPENRVTSLSTRPLRWLLLPWLLGLVLLDVANRRLAWDHRAMWGWVKAHATLPRRSAREAAGTMDALKRRRAAVQADPPSTAASAAEKLAATARRRQKFESPVRSTGNAPPTDFATATGGATHNDKTRQAAASPPPVADDAPTTNRLLAAKRRARQNLDE